MRLTTKGRFAVTAMIDLALRQEQGPVTLAGISQRQHISLSYLEQLFGKLRRHEIVESVRGPGGGYNLARRAGESPWPTSSSRSTSRSTPPSAAGKENCEGTKQHDGRCMTHELWATLNEKMVEYLDSVSLQGSGRPAASREGTSTVLRDRRTEARTSSRARRAQRTEFRFQPGRLKLTAELRARTRTSAEHA